MLNDDIGRFGDTDYFAKFYILSYSIPSSLRNIYATPDRNSTKVYNKIYEIVYIYE